MNESFDVIIVGGRVAGSGLAIRLGAMGVRVLLLERDTLPSVPAASSPIVYSPAMALLDELGVDESVYAHNTPKIQRWIIQAEGVFTAQKDIPAAHGRSYAYAIDRARFDAALWNRAASFPTVDARQGFAVTDLICENSRVVGVRAKNISTGEQHEFFSDLVVGADGRFSLVARKVNAKMVDEHTTQPTSLYYAYWKNFPPYHADVPVAHLYSTGGHYGLLMMPSADDTTVVAIEGRSDIVNPDGQSAETFYTSFLQSHPDVWRRLACAERVTPVRGMKRIANAYRQAGGVGWALVGDAVHQKDPIDGQGIYDALFTATALSHAIAEWRGGMNWSDALARYTAAIHHETRPMYRATQERVNREVYTRRPQWFMHTVARWLYEDETYLDRWSRVFVRDIDPATWFSYPVIVRAILRGLWRDLRR